MNSNEIILKYEIKYVLSLNSKNLKVIEHWHNTAGNDRKDHVATPIIYERKMLETSK